MSDGVEFSALELDALQETMNVGFGQAAASLSEVIDMQVVLSVPKVAMIANEGIAAFVRSEIRDPAAFCMVEQFFFGRFSGTSFLLLPENEGRKLVDLFGAQPDPEFAGESLDALERDIVVEIGNIIIGACVGKIAEMLKDVVCYHPPRYLAGPVDQELINRHIRPGGGLALVFKTVFKFERQDVLGFLFLVTGDDTASWLKKAVDEMLEGLL